MFATSFIHYIHGYQASFFKLILSFLILLLFVSFWFNDIVTESTYEGNHTRRVEKGLRYGMILFITSEVMLFASFFALYFYFTEEPSPEWVFDTWPPKGIEAINPWGLPLYNTVILLTSSLFVTLSHNYLIKGDRVNSLYYLIYTVIWGLAFTVGQYIEYIKSTFSINDSLYGGLFFMLTGLHGCHVILGTICLLVCLIRHFKYHLFSNLHFGFEASAWYWHFVDVVWIYLFIVLYGWDS